MSLDKLTPKKKSAMKTMAKSMQSQKVSSRKSKRNNFLIRMSDTENATWQGEILWLERKETVPFRSGLEMMCLIQSAVTTQNREAEAVPPLVE